MWCVKQQLLCLVSLLSIILCSDILHAASIPATEATHGIVISSHQLASQAGLEILRSGGNAIDAAVAVGYVEAVVNPCCGNIGGGGFMVLHLATGQDRFLDFRETAPAAASANMYLDKGGKLIEGMSRSGYRAVGVPGTVMGLNRALIEYGTMNRAAVMAPAIRLAREGFVVTRADTDIFESRTAQFRNQTNVAKVFLRTDGGPLRPGDRLLQPDLARTLEAIALDGDIAFYHGSIPLKVEMASKQNGGILTAADFASYKISESDPLRCEYHGYSFVSAPPPSSGGVTMCEILNILSGYDMKTLGWHSAASVHVLVEAMRYAYQDRNAWLGDPAFVSNPIERLLSFAYAAEVRASIPLRRKIPPIVGINAAAEKMETTHYSIIDQYGNATSVTYTLNGAFGAGVMAADTGILLNDEMDDFTIRPGLPNQFGLVQGKANNIAPGKRPLSSMAPTIITKDGRLAFVMGSLGGPRIITILLQIAVNMIDYGMEPQEAVDAPRIHYQSLPDEVFAEPFALSPDTTQILGRMGYKITLQKPWGAAEVAAVGLSGVRGKQLPSAGSDSSQTNDMRPGFLYGASDGRRPAGAALGY